MDLYLNILSGEDEDENGNLFEFKFSQKKKKMFLLKIIKIGLVLNIYIVNLLEIEMFQKR